jgi:hypothetical protein
LEIAKITLKINVISVIIYEVNYCTAKQSKACTVYDHLNIGITGSNPAWGMDVCPRVPVLCCPVSVEALRQADPPVKESYQMSLYVDREAH